MECWDAHHLKLQQTFASQSSNFLFFDFLFIFSVFFDEGEVQFVYLRGKNNVIYLFKKKGNGTYDKWVKVQKPECQIPHN